MPVRDLARVRHMQDAAKKALEFIEGLDFDTFRADEMLNLAVVRLLEVMGEAAASVSVETKTAHPGIPWRQMIAMRNRLIHGYFDVDPAVVWSTVQSDLPPLLEGLETALLFLEG